MSKGIILVGGTGNGKTFFIKKLISKYHKDALRIFDVNNEYSEFCQKPFNPDIDEFLDECYRTKNGVILIEDATAFLSNKGRSDTLTKILVGKRHTKNTIILLFHSFRAVPKYILDLCNHVVIFKTNDSQKIVESLQRDEITKGWLAVQNAAKNHKFWSSYPPPKNIAPPNALVNL